MKAKKIEDLMGFTDICENEYELVAVNGGCSEYDYPRPNNFTVSDYVNPLVVDNYNNYKAASSAAGRNYSYGSAPSHESRNRRYQKEQGYGIYKYRR